MSDITQVMAPHDVVPQVQVPQQTFGAPRRAVQWGSGGESRINDMDRDAISEAVDDCSPTEYRRLFPLHGAFGALSLHVDGHTLFLFTNGGAFIVGELVDPSTVRAKGIPSSGHVDVTRLAPEVQAAIAHLLRAASK